MHHFRLVENQKLVSRKMPETKQYIYETLSLHKVGGSWRCLENAQMGPF